MSDDPRPCKGTNTNVCVGEGCYAESCLDLCSTCGCSEENHSESSPRWCLCDEGCNDFIPRRLLLDGGP